MKSNLALPPAQRTRYPRNRWYVAAAGDELQDQLMGRKLLGEQVLLYRTRSGTPVAMSDWCPHRGFRLSRAPSRRVDDIVYCGYHGISFDPSGACVRSPFQKKVPPQMRLEKFPVVESGQWIWIWMGDPGKAASTPVPRLKYQTHDYNRRVFFNLEMECNFQLLNENLLDFTHATFLHPGLSDNEYDDDWDNTLPDVHSDGNSVTVSRVVKRIVPEAMLAKNFGLLPGQAVSRRVELTLEAPGYVTFIDTYRSFEDPDRIISEQIGESPVTPTSDTGMLNWASAYASRDISGQDIHDAFLKAVLEDKLALEFAQQAHDLRGDKFIEVSLQQDLPAFRARRIIAEMVAAEAEQEC